MEDSTGEEPARAVAQHHIAVDDDEEENGAVNGEMLAGAAGSVADAKDDDSDDEDERCPSLATVGSLSLGGARPKIHRLQQQQQTHRPPPSLVEPDSSDSDQAATSHANGFSVAAESETEASGDDLYVYTYKGDGYLSADLPRSFYHDGGSDSEGGSGAVGGLSGTGGDCGQRGEDGMEVGGSGQPPRGVSGAGQSNLSTEVAALLQGDRLYQANRTSQATAANNNGERQSPEMDFLEMDFVGSDEEDQDDSGGERGDVAASVAKEEENVAIQNHAAAMTSQSDEEAALVRVPASLNLEQDRGDPPKSSGGGVTSAPAVTPVREDLSVMVRSRSLNSSLVSSAGVGGGGLHPCLVDPPPTSSESAGSSGRFLDSSALAACNSRLSQRAALVFGVLPPPASSSPQTSPLTNAVSDVDETRNISSLTEKTMIWTESEACRRQVTQIGTSACGATAVINVLQALDVPFGGVDEVAARVGVRRRSETAPLPRYLISRSDAGASHRDLIRAMESYGLVARFFHMYPRRRVRLAAWLQKWIRFGAVPIVTINPQRRYASGGASNGDAIAQPSSLSSSSASYASSIPDAWHHQV